MRSMTGFGKSVLETPKYRLKAEIKSVNSRFLDLNYRLPKLFNPVEETVRETISKALSRGKIDLYLEYNLVTGEEGAQSIEADLDFIKSYVGALETVRETCEIDEKISLAHILKQPQSIRLKEEDLDQEAFKEDIRTILGEALDGLISAREREGEALKAALLDSIYAIEKSVQLIEEALPEILDKFKKDFYERIEELTSDISLNEERLETEIAIFVDKKDIKEEIVRIHAHLKEAKRLMNESEPVGRNLDFIAQELNREINTIGSKASGLVISQEVIRLKTTLEQFREQIQNVE